MDEHSLAHGIESSNDGEYVFEFSHHSTHIRLQNRHAFLAYYLLPMLVSHEDEILRTIVIGSQPAALKAYQLSQQLLVIEIDHASPVSNG